MKRISLVVLCSVCAMISAHAQSVKTQMQTQNVSIGLFNASLTYPYYEDSNGNYVKHGVANISSNSTYRDDDGTQMYKMSGSATFAHGKLDGTFHIEYTMSGHVWNHSLRIWTNGSKTLSIKGGFKNGLPDGHWTGEGTYDGFGGYKQDFPDKIDVTYKDGILIGTFDYIYISNNGGLFEGNGKTDTDGYYDGKCILLGCEEKIELTCKNRWLVLQLLRGTNGEVKERYDFGETRQKAIDSLVSGDLTEQEVFERYGFVGADHQYTYCWNTRGACPEGFLYGNFPTEFQKLTGISVEDIKFDGGKYRFLRDEKWIRLNQNVVDSILLNSSITADSYEFNAYNAYLDKYRTDNADKYPDIYYFRFNNQKYMVWDQSLSLYDSLKIKYNAKIAEKKEEYRLAKQKEDLEDFKNDISNRMKSEYAFLALIPDSVSRQSGKLTDYKNIVAVLSEGDPMVAVDFEWHCLANDIYKHYRLYIKQDKNYYDVIDSCILVELEVTKNIRSQVRKAEENEAIIAKYSQNKAYKDIVSLYLKRSDGYNLTPNYKTSIKAQTDYLQVITGIVTEQDAFIRFLRLREQLTTNHTEIMSIAKPYKNITKAYSSLYKSFVLSYNQTAADEDRLKEYIHLQEKLILSLTKDASRLDAGIKGIKDTMEIKRYIEKL